LNESEDESANGSEDDEDDLSEEDEQISDDEDVEAEGSDDEIGPKENLPSMPPSELPEDGSVTMVAPVTAEHAAAPRYTAPWSSPAASTSSAGSEPYPVTPPSTKRNLKRAYDEMVDVASGSDAGMEYSPVADKVQKVGAGDITHRQGGGYLKTAGLIALGAVFGSVGTIAGLMQLSD